ncbi:glucose 1-dehydrogenase [Flavitalea sp. BT771]|uniref:SDR family NAD(P)-dependent oxidoreductase n=1 Tax=Flavitalea sp. BT771 TaxID=3063329 RepID=UPI0026E2B431|nr:glucose 1-dehydrogenase [Flavitalea sp. BT771]MDO6432489.1 glucose 1-dehydrogenase [Flavitalea sp. BT771]MDV6221398.1 glucose 1-dehydrogenase [Flavitalea sp. BT771]
MQTASPNKVAIVTGGGGGIGLAIAENFVSHDITTVIIGRNQEKLNAAGADLGPLCHPVCQDLDDLAALPGLIQQIITRFGRIDILVNNAGINQKKELTDVSDLEFQRILHTNVSVVFALSREVVRSMVAAGNGVIINISSMAAQYGIPKVIAYSASKSAIEGMTKAMAVELAPKGIRVNCIAPGFIATDMSEKALNGDAERKQKVMSRTPMGRLGAPADIGEAALYLVSEGAKYVTGVVLPVDGGNSIGF